MTSSSEPVRLTWQGVRDGLKLAPPLMLNSGIYGIIFGVLAAQYGLTALESGIMSATVFAGAAQILIVETWSRPVPVVAVVLGLMMVNARHVLMAVALRPHLEGLPAWKQMLAASVIVDDNWAMTMTRFEQGYRDAGYILGLALLAVPAWTVMTVVGNVLGGVIDDPRRFGFDFIIVALAIVVLVGRWRGSSTLIPWGVAAVVAVATSHLVPGKVYIVAGAIAGSFAGLLRKDPAGPLKAALGKPQ
jgi:4-azaleucine resistance transporter AzlC